MTAYGPAELGRRLVERAYLEGDFVLRSGRRSTRYFDKYLFETQPQLLRALGQRIARKVREHEPNADFDLSPGEVAGQRCGRMNVTALAHEHSVEFIEEFEGHVAILLRSSFRL